MKTNEVCDTHQLFVCSPLRSTGLFPNGKECLGHIPPNPDWWRLKTVAGLNVKGINYDAKNKIRKEIR